MGALFTLKGFALLTLSVIRWRVSGVTFVGWTATVKLRNLDKVMPAEFHEWLGERGAS